MSTNVFEIIEKVTSRIEPFHSEFFAASLRNDKGLLNNFLMLIRNKNIDESYLTFSNINGLNITSENSFDDFKRIDITIQDPISKIIIGIEVKTSDSSVTKSQLAFYYYNLLRKYPNHNVVMVYLTPFNLLNIPDTVPATSIHAITEFSEFSNECRNSVHISWDDVVNLYNLEPDKINSIYQQHREYIISKITNKSLLIGRLSFIARNRDLAEFFGAGCVELFIDFLRKGGIKYTEDDKKIVFNISDNVNNYERLIQLFEILINSDQFQKKLRKHNKVEESLIRKYEQGVNGDFFKILFGKLNTYSYLWLDGTGRIGVRAFHKSHPNSGVSIITLDEANIVIYKNR